MKTIITLMAVLLVLLLAASCEAASITLAWDLSEDDAALTATGGYKVFQATASGAYTATPIATVAPGVGTVTFNPGKFGLLYWVVQAFDGQGHTSGYSNEVSTTVAIGTVKNLRIPAAAKAPSK